MGDGIQKKSRDRQPQFPSPISHLLFRSRPTLFHQCEQMFQRFLVSLIFFGGQLFRALVELRGHVGGFLSWAAERDEDLGKLGNFHKINGGYSYLSAFLKI